MLGVPLYGVDVPSRRQSHTAHSRQDAATLEELQSFK